MSKKALPPHLQQLLNNFEQRNKEHITTPAPRTVKAEVIKNWAGGWDTFGYGYNFPQNQSSPFSQQISNVTTSFVNLRWYFISNFRQFLSELYCEIGLVQTLCNVPVQDALSGGVTIKSQELSEEQMADLRNSLDRDDDLGTVGQAECWNRLFGGAGILILTNQDPRTPLDLAQINEKENLEFRAVDMWELFWDKQNTEGYIPELDYDASKAPIETRPGSYDPAEHAESYDPATQTEEFEYYNYYGEQVHKTRVMRLTGITAPSFLRPRLRGWGFSAVEPLIRSLNQYLQSTTVAFDVMNEFKLDIYKVKNLVNTLMSPTGAQDIKQRVAQTNYTKNYQNAIVMDSEDDFLQKQLSFAGLSDTMQQIRMQVASDLRMPMLKLFGTPASGLNASDEESMEVYNAMVESEVRNKIKYPILRILEIKCQQRYGFIPSDLSIEFKPLRQMKAPDIETVKNAKYNRLLRGVDLGLISPDEFRDACNKGDLFDIKLDKGPTVSGGYNDDTIAEGFNDPYKPKDIDNPGADRLDTQKSRATEVGGIGKPLMKPAPKSADIPEQVAKSAPKQTTFGPERSELPPLRRAK